MKPVDYRNDSWSDLQARVAGLRLTVYEALLQHGPCTTRELARRSGVDILTVRPRVTELFQLGWVVVVDAAAVGHEGAYRALTEAEARQVFDQRRRDAVGTRVQGELALLS